MAQAGRSAAGRFFCPQGLVPLLVPAAQALDLLCTA